LIFLADSSLTFLIKKSESVVIKKGTYQGYMKKT